MIAFTHIISVIRATEQVAIKTRIAIIRVDSWANKKNFRGQMKITWKFVDLLPTSQFLPSRLHSVNVSCRVAEFL